jgi:hypothetical protein
MIKYISLEVKTIEINDNDVIGNFVSTKIGKVKST